MSSIFNVDGPLFSGLGKIADLFFLNILFLICCIPLFTIGTSISALYYVTLKMVKNEEGHISQSFFKAFKMNFKQGTAIWLIAVAVGGILLADYAIMSGYVMDLGALPDLVRKVLLVLLLVVGICYLFTVRYVFPLLARFENSVKNTIINAFLISVRHLPYTVLLLLIVAAGIALLYFFPRLLILLFILFFSSIAYFSSYLFVKIFAYYMPEEEEDKEAEQ